MTETIYVHWPIFIHWCKEQLRANMMPEGAELIKWWYRYCSAWNDYQDSLRENVMPEPPEGSDE